MLSWVLKPITLDNEGEYVHTYIVYTWVMLPEQCWTWMCLLLNRHTHSTHSPHLLRILSHITGVGDGRCVLDNTRAAVSSPSKFSFKLHICSNQKRPVSLKRKEHERWPEKYRGEQQPTHNLQTQTPFHCLPQDCG